MNFNYIRANVPKAHLPMGFSLPIGHKGSLSRCCLHSPSPAPFNQSWALPGATQPLPMPAAGWRVLDKLHRTQGFPGFFWQNLPGAEGGGAGTSPTCQPSVKQPSSHIHGLHKSQSQPPSQRGTWIFFQLSLKSNHGVGSACTPGQVRWGLVACAVSDFQMGRQD